MAYACDPTKGSEHGVGWGWVNAIAQNHDLTVITADFNVDHIRQHLQESQPSSHRSPRFIYVKNSPWHYQPSPFWISVENSIAKPLMNLAYQNWLDHAYRVAQAEVAQSHYDVVHLITYVGWRFPGRFYSLGIPFVWGPIGGIKNTPARLLPILGLKGAIYYSARNIVNSSQVKLLRGPRHALRSANEGVIAATSEIQDALWKHFKVRSQVICEVGPSEGLTPRHISREPSDTFRISWSGQHLPGKALHLLLRALRQLPQDINYSVEILGDGPYTRRWQALATRLNIHNRCNWHGWLPRDRALAVMSDSHVFVITSLKDLTSTVALEALSLGLPIISLDHCGFADLVNDKCGIKLKIESAHQIEYDLSRSLLALYSNEEFRKVLAQGAFERSKSYSWRLKMNTLDRLYDSVTHSSAASNNTIELDC